jgi:putative transposase
MYAFIDCNRGRYSVGMMARVLRISPRSYYDHKRGIHSIREQRRESIEKAIREAYLAAKGRYGAPRIAAELQKKDISVSVNTISRYMKRMGLRSKLGRKWRNVSYPEYTLRICPNHLDRQFRADAPGKVWVSDITYIHTTHGFRYLTSVIDLFDRKTVGWSLSSNLTAADTAVRAYKMAVRNRKPQPGMIFHSDRGVQYASEEFRNTLDKNVVQSMSRKGNCWDNAVAESFFKSLKCELIYDNKTLTPEQLELEIFEYIEIWYNKVRRHSALQNMTIDEFWKINEKSA